MPWVPSLPVVGVGGRGASSGGAPVDPGEFSPLASDTSLASDTLLFSVGIEA